MQTNGTLLGNIGERLCTYYQIVQDGVLYYIDLNLDLALNGKYKKYIDVKLITQYPADDELAQVVNKINFTMPFNRYMYLDLCAGVINYLSQVDDKSWVFYSDSNNKYVSYMPEGNTRIKINIKHFENVLVKISEFINIVVERIDG
jgi:hypothetical protein